MSDRPPLGWRRVCQGRHARRMCCHAFPGAYPALVAVYLFIACCAAYALDLVLVDDFSDTFPGTTTVWRVKVNAAAPTEFTWHLSLGAAVVDRGHVSADTAMSARSVEFPVRVPPLRDGVTGEAALTVVATSDGQSAKLVHPVWILPVDPWSGLRADLAGRTLWLFDPGRALSARLAEAGLNTTAVRNTAALAALTNGLVLVADGVSLRTQRGLADALVRAAAGGAQVILLAPLDGVIPLPGHDGMADLPRPDVRLGGVAALRQLDKRLDAHFWPGPVPAVSASVVLSAERRQSEAVWSADGTGWVWLEMEFRTSGGRLLAVGWAPTKAWSYGPAPRHVLAALIRHVLH